MLAVHIAIGESLRANGLWDLHLLGFNELGRYQFRLEVRRDLPMVVGGLCGVISGVCLKAGDDHEFSAVAGGRILIGDAKLHLWQWRNRGVKFGVIAPPAIRLLRPAQHGSLTAAV